MIGLRHLRRQPRSTAFSLIPRVAAHSLLLLTLGIGVLTYREPYMCNPCSEIPSATSHVRVPDDALYIWVYYNWRGRFFSVWSTLPGEWAVGSTEDPTEVPALVQREVKRFPALPVVIRADRDAPYGRVQVVLDSLRAAGSRNLFFETTLRQ